MIEKIMYFLMFLSCYFVISVLVGFAESMNNGKKFEIGNIRLVMFWISISYISTIIATGFGF